MKTPETLGQNILIAQWPKSYQNIAKRYVYINPIHKKQKQQNKKSANKLQHYLFVIPLWHKPDKWFNID